MKTDYRSDFENRCNSKIDARLVETGKKHGIQVAKAEDTIRRHVCDCVAPHSNTDLDIIWKTISVVSTAMRNASKIVETDRIEEILSLSKSDFDNICPKNIEYLKKRYKGKKADKVEEAGKTVCNCISENVMPFIDKNLPTFLTAMYDAKRSLRGPKDIKKFEKEMKLDVKKRSMIYSL